MELQGLQERPTKMHCPGRPHVQPQMYNNYRVETHLGGGSFVFPLSTITQAPDPAIGGIALRKGPTFSMCTHSVLSHRQCHARVRHTVKLFQIATACEK